MVYMTRRSVSANISYKQRTDLALQAQMTEAKEKGFPLVYVGDVVCVVWIALCVRRM